MPTYGCGPRENRMGEEPGMDKQGRIRLSTMEIILVATMLGALLLGLLQAFAEERSRRARIAADEATIETQNEH